MYRPQIYACDAVVVVHVLEIVRDLAPDPVSEGLLRDEMHSCSRIGIDEGEAHELEPPLDRGCAAGPEVSHAGSLLAGLADVARINGNRTAARVAVLPDECAVEGYPVERLPEVHAEPLFGRASEPPQLKEVDAVRYGKKKFHGLDEECTERFA